MRPATTRSCCPNADCEDAPIRRRRVVMTSRWLMGRHVVRNNHAATTSMHPRCLGKGAISLYRLNGTALAISKSSCHFATEIFRALAPGRERDIETYEKLYSRGLLD